MHKYKTDFAATRVKFHLPDGVIYLDGNSLGPLPIAAIGQTAKMMHDEWGDMLIRAWNQAGWMDQPSRIGSRIARLIGAEKDSVVIGDTLSIKVYQALAAALKLKPNRKVILSDNGNFPSDLYMAQGLIDTLAQGHILKAPNPETVEAALDESVAVLMLTEVDYRTSRMHDMQKLTARAQDLGIVTIWDLAHSAGAIPVNLAKCNADFAVGCTYKYLNGGPGAPAFIYVSPRHQEIALPTLSGWLGHAAPFNFETAYRPGKGVERLRVGTPPVIAMRILETALDIWDDVDINDVRQKSIDLTQLFITEIEKSCPDLTLASPRNPSQRGSHVSFQHANAYPVMQALISQGVIGDFRAPDLLRFSFTPLFTCENDVISAVRILQAILTSRGWDHPKFRQLARVT